MGSAEINDIKFHEYPETNGKIDDTMKLLMIQEATKAKTIVDSMKHTEFELSE